MFHQIKHAREEHPELMEVGRVFSFDESSIRNCRAATCLEAVALSTATEMCLFVG